MAELHDETDSYIMKLDFIGSRDEYYYYKLSFLTSEGQPLLDSRAMAYPEVDTIEEWRYPSLFSFFGKISEETEPGVFSWCTGVDEFQHSFTVYANQPFPAAIIPKPLETSEEYWKQICKEMNDNSFTIVASMDVNGKHNAPCGPALIMTVSREAIKRFSADLRAEIHEKINKKV